MKISILSGIFIFFCFTIDIYAQLVYSGSIGKASLELVVVPSDYDTTASGVYLYKKYNEPISLTGTHKGKMLTLFETDKNKNKTGQFIFESYDNRTPHVTGIWKNLKTNASFPVELKLLSDVKKSAADSSGELLQCESTADFFFKLIVESIDSELKVSGIKVFEKKTGRIKQVINCDCRYFESCKSLEVEDYNFDGENDFSIEKDIFASANDSRFYILWDHQDKRFFDTGFEGINLIFDSSTKTVREPISDPVTNTYHISIYVIKKNALVLKEKFCQRYNEKVDDYETIKCK